MSRAAVEQRKKDKAAARRAASNESFMRMAEYSSAIDSAVVACDDCGLLNVTSKGLSCFLCGGEVGTSTLPA
jgi:hypothetical protein